MVFDIRDPSERDELLTPARAERRGPVAIEPREAVASEQIEPRIDAVVEPDIEGIVVERLAAGRNEIVARAVLRARPVRQWNQLQDRQRLRRQPAVRNDVVAELCPRRGRGAAQGIKHIDAVRAQIAVARRGSRHREQPRASDFAPQSLIVAEEEHLVLPDRSAQRSTKLIPRRVRNELAGQRIGQRLRKRVALLQTIVEVELERAAVQSVRARLRLYGNDAGSRLSELRVVILRRDLRFLNRIEIRVDDDDAENRIAVLGAVELVTGAAEVLPVHHRLRRALRVLARRVLPLKLLGAGRQQDEFREVAIEDGQIVDLLRFEGRRDIGAIGLEQRAETGDRHVLADRPEVEPDVQFRLRVDVHLDVGKDRRPEAGQLGLDLVRAWQQAFLDVQAGLVRDDCVHGLALCARDGDGNAGHHGAGRVGDDAADAAVDRLRDRSRRRKHRQDERDSQCVVMVPEPKDLRAGDHVPSPAESGESVEW